jgi:hypothetical protein
MLSKYDKEFLKAPELFLCKYAIIPLNGQLHDPVRGTKLLRARFSFREAPGLTPGGIAEKVLLLEDVPRGIPAYWLAYEADKSKRAVLGDAEGFMFTANMDGCSFGYGSETGTGAVLVGHANAASTGVETVRNLGHNPYLDVPADAVRQAREAQAAAQRQMLQKKMNPGTLTVLEPSDYLGHNNLDRCAATVVGIRRRAGWNFYYQLRSVTTENQYVLSGIKKLNHIPAW